MLRHVFIAAIVLMLAGSLLVQAGCGESEGAVSEEVHAKIQNGMTMDEVDGVAGQPDRSHSIGSAQEPQVFWYYGKTDGEGFVRVVFIEGKVTTVSPYDETITPES